MLDMSWFVHGQLGPNHLITFPTSVSLSIIGNFNICNCPILFGRSMLFLLFLFIWICDITIIPLCSVLATLCNLKINIPSVLPYHTPLCAFFFFFWDLVNE